MTWERIPLLLAAQKARPYLAEMAELLGMEAEQKPEADRPVKETDQGEQPLEQPDKNRETTATGQHPLFWRIEKIEQKEAANTRVPDWLKKPSQPSRDQGSGTYLFDLPEPVRNLPALLPLLFNGLGEEARTSRLDQKKLIRQAARGLPIEKLPRRVRTRWPRCLTIIRDEHRSLFPHWHDFTILTRQLEDLLGTENIDHLCFDEQGPAELDWCREQCQTDNTPWQPGANDAVLILSDLNDYGSMTRCRDWLELLIRLQDQGCRVITLSPATGSPPHPLICALARPHSLFPAAAPPRRPEKKGFQRPVDKNAITAALTMLSALPLTDRGLLRKLRRAFAWGSPVLEGLLWNHPEVQPGYLGIRVNDPGQYQSEFSQIPNREQNRFWRIVAQHHETAYPGLKNLEQLKRIALSPAGTEAQENTEAVLSYYRHLLTRLYAGEQDSREQEALAGQLKTVLALVDLEAQSRPDQALQELLAQTYGTVFAQEISKGDWSCLPPGLNPEQVPRLKPAKEEQALPYSFRQQGLQGEAVISASPEGSAQAAAEVLSFSASPALPAFITLPGRYRKQVRPDLHLQPAREQALQLSTGQTHYFLRAMQRPAFAASMGRDQDGLFLEPRANEPEKRLYWLPGESDLQEKKTLPGLWSPILHPGQDTGRDQYGLYRDLVLNGVEQRFRWIEPGCFWMGSPEDEAERWDDEDLHHVTLTAGFWLADSTVSQTLWQAVMGNNHSAFKGADRPVEQVSWDDAQKFIKKLNKKHPELQARLPWEAEWEYGCRAGTDSPFSFGENINPQQVNYDGSSPYADGEKGLDRAETVPIRSLPVNPWGLYEMHGNVWEWCQDYWQENLGTKSVSDPHGSDTGGSRVVRGGSWGYGGGIVRSACRNGYEPGDRDRGFRLALGH